MIDDRLARIMAYVDGELDPSGRSAFEAEMADDPALAAAVARHRALTARLSTTYAPVLEEPVPIRLARAARPWRVSAPAPTWAALAATLVLGVLVGRFALTPAPPVEVGRDAPAGSPLALALDRALAAEQGPVRIGLTIRDGGGAYCRTFQSEPDRLAGLACRRGEAWRVLMATAWAPSATPDYRTAATAAPPEVLAAVDRMSAGEALGRDEETTARERGWRP